MTRRPATWKVVTFGAALTGLGVTGAGLAVADDDVVDVNVKVWGDEWEQRLGQLTATVSTQGPVTRAWGHPVHVRGDVTIDGERA